MMNADLEEVEAPRRRKNGTFAPGSSGNLNGRPAKQGKRHRLPHENHRVAIDIAETAVKVHNRQNGSVEEMTAYEGIMRKLAEKAASGDLRAIRMYLQEMEKATAARVEQVGIAQALLATVSELEEELALVRKHFPTFKGTGVVNILPDGSEIPGSWTEPLRKLETLEAWEKKLRHREQTLNAREAAAEFRK